MLNSTTRCCLIFLLVTMAICAQEREYRPDNTNRNKFKQLYEELPTPNSYRTASGAPGHAYWQQRADYDMHIELDDEQQRIYGDETITTYNHSPDVLTYLWLQLDQNVRARDSDRYKVEVARQEIEDSLEFADFARIQNDFDGGFKIEYVRTGGNRDLPYTINGTMMRVDLPAPLNPGGKFTFKIKWWYNINNRMRLGGRSGYEYFADDDNYVYTIAQFYPRMAMYSDVDGWQHKQFLGRGEFTLVFGNYRMALTVPADHVVASTGTLQNPGAVLTAAQRKRFQRAATAYDKPVLIVTPEEAQAAEKQRAKAKKTWIFAAENVRDFAWASSRKFIWDAMGVPMGNRTVMAMSYYPREANPLWEQYSTPSVAHTLRVYSRFTFDYPYPVAISVHTDRIGMEYPMICFNGRRPLADGTYSERAKFGLISVIIHEVGHNYFPMIVNSDERQWTWMDEGLNSFLQYLSEQEWERDYPSRRGPAHKIVDYMQGDKAGMTPIMTNSESIYQFGNNAYGKPAAALNILRETVLGRELFDFAFKTYAQRWMFRHPTPADFFRTMEDASGTDLDWFWRGWFYTTDHVDLAIDEVRWMQVDTRNPHIEKPLAQQREDEQPAYISDIRNRQTVRQTLVEGDSALGDFYNRYDPYAVDTIDEEEFEKYSGSLSAEQLALLESDQNYYQIRFRNIGGLPMPLILAFEFRDGSTERQKVPAEIWRFNEDSVSYLFITDKELTAIHLDPNLETADTDRNNNHWPRQAEPSRFKLFKERQERENPMQRQRRIEKK